MKGNYSVRKSVAIKKMKENKAADESGVIAEYLKALEVEEVEKQRGLMNGILNGADIPKEWKESRVKLLHKGGRTDELKNYRPDRDNKCNMQIMYADGERKNI